MRKWFDSVWHRWEGMETACFVGAWLVDFAECREWGLVSTRVVWRWCECE